MEKRRKSEPLPKSSPLPVDYTSMVAEVFAANFDAGLKLLSGSTGGRPCFTVHGELYPDEILLGISILVEGQLAATTVYASTDFDPRASSPTVEDLLSACVDAAGSLFGTLLDPGKPDRIAQLADRSLAALENVPFEWTPLEIEKRTIFLRVDKANPDLERMTDDWLARHDPDKKARSQREHDETERLFMTGEEAKKKVLAETGRAPAPDPKKTRH
jgi:hypothetical protein